MDAPNLLDIPDEAPKLSRAKLNANKNAIAQALGKRPGRWPDVANQTEMLALTGATPGDVVFRSDVGKTFQLAALPPTTLNSWVQIGTADLSGFYSKTQVDDLLGAKASSQALSDEVARAGQAEAGLTASVANVAAALLGQQPHRWDVRRFINTGETLYQDGSASVSTILQRAIDAAAAAAATLGPIQIFVPDGRYRIATALVPRTLVGIAGESTAGTVFLPYGNQSFMYGNDRTGADPYVDCQFTNFTVDGINQASGFYTTGIKGFYIAYMLRAKFHRVNVFNTFATGFGVDYLHDSIFESCIAKSCGRGFTDPLTQSGGSGFGLGTGEYARESVSMINCIAESNGFNGFFTEKQSSKSYYPTGFRLIGCHAYDNYIGFKDAGSTGAVVEGCQFTENKLAGVSIDTTSLTPQAGHDGILSGCVVSGNNTLGNALGGGIVIGSSTLGAYSIKGNQVFANVGDGIRISNRLSAGVNISQNDIYANSGSGIHVLSSGTVTHWSIRGNRCYNNGANASASCRDGITVEAATVNCNFRGNECFDSQSSKTQQYGLRFHSPSIASAGLAVSGNDLRFNATDSLSVQHVLSSAIIRDNDGFDPSVVSGVGIVGADPGAITLSWMAPAGVAGITDYSVQFATASTGPWTSFAHGVSTTTTMTVSGLTSDVTYWFRVAHVVSGVIGTYSVPIRGIATSLQFADSFNRADNASSLGSTDSGSSPATAWAVASAAAASWGVASNMAAPKSGATSFAMVDTGLADGTVEATLGATGEWIGGLLCRGVDIDNATYLTMYGSPSSVHKYCVWSKNNGTSSIVFTSNVTPVAGDKLRIVMDGRELRFYVNNVLLYALTTATRVSATKHGFLGSFTSAPSVRWDNWSFRPSVQ